MTVKVYTGKNLEELLNSVAAEKVVSVEELTYTVKEEKSGFLGIGGRVEAEVYCGKNTERVRKAGNAGICGRPHPHLPAAASREDGG